MSWVEKIATEFIIKTGDGIDYGRVGTFPLLWKNPVKEVEFNIAEFEFPELPGTLVSRGTPKGRRFPLEFYFQGDNHLDQAQRFEKSANDPRAWTVTHPYYGTIIAQPLTLNFDNSVENITKVTGVLIETIVEQNPKGSINPTDKVKTDSVVMSDKFSSSFANNVKPDTRNLNVLSTNTSQIYKEGKKGLKFDVNAEKYFNLFNDANAKILEVTSKPLEAMRAIEAMINYPSMFVDGVKNRINIISNQFNLLRSTLSSLTRRSDKKIYEHNGGLIVGAVVLSTVTSFDDTISQGQSDAVDLQIDDDKLNDEAESDSVRVDYAHRNDAIEAIEIVLDTYSTYLEDLDDLQSDNAGELESYVPDVDAMIALNDLVNFAVSTLLDIALNSRQERSVILEEDSNAILLTHRFYGLQEDDSTLDEFIRTNNIGLNELLHIRKGRRIVYYV